MRSLAEHDIAARIRYSGLGLEEVACEVVMQKLKTMGGEGGVVALDRQGQVCMVFNSNGMYRGYMKEEGKPVTAIFKKDLA